MAQKLGEKITVAMAIPYMAAVYKLTVRVMEHMKRLKEELYSYPRPLLPAQMAVARFL